MSSTSLSARAASAPIVARLARISVSDYRVFPAGSAFEFSLGADGRNLLLFGENGSGKTSLFRAIRDVMATQPPPKDFADARNFFAPGEEGFISVGLTAGSMSEIRWDYGNAHPRQTGGQPYVLFAERCRFLDYRALLETNFVHRTPTPNLYRLLINDVLKDLAVTVSGKQERLGSVHKRMLDARPLNHRSRRRLRSVDRACTDFSLILTNHLPEIVKAGNEILSKLQQDGLAFDLHPGTIRYDRFNRAFAGEQITLSVTMFGQPIAEPQRFLNEARLTALALAIYLGAARLILKSVATSGDETTPVRLLVLDDVLIGLDLANRLPVLKVINEEFAEWQILLFTYDHVWFDLAREFTEHAGGWTYFTLRELPTTPGNPGRPFIEPALDALAIAGKHFPADLVASAVYIRAAFEKRVKNVCRDHGVLVPYKPDPKEVKIDKLWQGIVDRQHQRKADGKADFIDPALMADIETVRSTILNRLSHSGAPTFHTTEVKFALDAVTRLCNHNFTHI